MGYILGLDIGTTTVKAVLVESTNHTVYKKHSENTFAGVESPVPNGDEQSVPKILSAIAKVMSMFSQTDLKEVTGVSISGQMHGCVLWSDGGVGVVNQCLQVSCDNACSHLITWQDKRCSQAFLDTFPCTSVQNPVRSGYGCATLYWLAKHQPGCLSFTRAGTIMDLVVWGLCGEGNVIMSDQNAYSWGYYDNQKGEWETDCLYKFNEPKFPVHLLPSAIKKCPSIAGGLKNSWHNVAIGTPVSVAMGDMQAAVKACQPDGQDAVLSVGTASQLVVVKPSTVQFDVSRYPSVVEVPYFNEQTLVVAAALTGGNAIAKFVEFLREFLTSLHISETQVNDDLIYSTLIDLAKTKYDTPLKVDPVLLGERHRATATGTVTNITSDYVSVGDVSAALMRGVLENIASMMPDEVFHKLKISKIIGVGTTLQRNSALADLVRKVLHLPLQLCDNDTPIGAALAMTDKVH